MLIIFWSGDLIVFLLFIVYILCSIISTQYFTKNLTLIKNKLMESGRRSYQIQTDSVENINVTKNNNAFDFVFNRYARILDEEKDSALVYAKWTNYMSITNALLSVFLFGGCFIYTLYGVIENSYTIGYFVMILSYIVMLSQPIEGLANSYSQIKQSLSFLDGFIQKFIKETPWKKSKNILQINSPIRIKIENVYFHYPNKDEDVLKNINLDICDSKFITFTGYSGSGKTTLVKLLSFHIDGYQGSIKINNEDIRNYTQDSLKQNIYYVTQDEFIFMDTLRFNLLVAKPDATDDELVSALLLANFSYQNIDKINKDILDMELGNKGMSLSGGQKQRISLARLFLRNPQLIIIDESTSALDVMNEKIILENIIRTFPHAIKISISHRPTTFTYSDVIYIFENGEIVDSGTLENLLKRNYYIQTIVQQVNETSERELEG